MLPPTYEVHLSGLPGFKADVTYTLMVKVTKTKGGFTSDMALLKLIYLAHNNIKQKWTMPLSNWATTAQKLAIWFPGRMILDLM